MISNGASTTVTGDSGDDALNTLPTDVNDDDDEGRGPPQRLIRAEAILRRRTSRILLVLDSLCDPYNHSAIIRTADAMGIQHVWSVDNGRLKTYSKAVSMSVSTGTERWISLRMFDSVQSCISQLRADGRTIWVTALSEAAKELSAAAVRQIPDRLAIVIGRELDGVGAEFISAADETVYLPMFGFSDSFNVSVATALVLQRLFDISPEARGQMSEDERQTLRRQWWDALAVKNRAYVEERFMPLVDSWNVTDDDIRKSDAQCIARINPKTLRRVNAAATRGVSIYRAPTTYKAADESKQI